MTKWKNKTQTPQLMTLEVFWERKEANMVINFCWTYKKAADVSQTNICKSVDLQICATAAAHLEVGENSSDVFFKAHVNHPVGLIEGQVAADVQTDHLLLE